MNLSLAKFSHLCPSSQLESGGDNITGKWWSFFPPGCASQRTIHPSFLSPVMCAYIASANKRCKSLIFLTSERAAQPVTNKPLPCSRLPTLFFQASSHLLSAYPNPCSGFFLAFQKSSGHNSATGLNLFRLAKMPLFRATWLGQECHLVEHLVHCQHIRLGQRRAGGWLAEA